MIRVGKIIFNENEIKVIEPHGYRDGNGLSQTGANIVFKDGSERAYQNITVDDVWKEITAKEV